MSNLVFNRSFDPRYGEAVAVAPAVRRVTARNPGLYTFLGTNTYLVGETELAVLDPGPDDAAHVAAVLDAAGGLPVTSILLTHSHRDHSGAAGALKAATGAPLLAALHAHRRESSDPGPEGAHSSIVPDRRLTDGAIIDGKGWRLQALATPGHASDHLSLALSGTELLFTGDHVMGWSTSIVAPPDGSMHAYMTSLDRLMARPERRYLPGHGGIIEDGKGFAAGLAEHRRERERAILARLSAGDRRIADIVARVYRDTDPRLHSAAALSVLAHLEALIEAERVIADGPPGLDALFAPA